MRGPLTMELDEAYLDEGRGCSKSGEVWRSLSEGSGNFTELVRES